uniref:Uncharacterized protein n=1 Tax=Phlebotomus papatasi TaxID=29031 RepID=A0A1B0D285_PHLPP
MSIVVLFALRNALDAVRKDSGASDGTYYSLGAPTTPEDILILAGNSTDHIRFPSRKPLQLVPHPHLDSNSHQYPPKYPLDAVGIIP